LHVTWIRRMPIRSLRAEVRFPTVPLGGQPGTSTKLKSRTATITAVDRSGRYKQNDRPRTMVASRFSLDAAKSWTARTNRRRAEFYHRINDTRTPYTCRAKQDNSTVAIASRSDEGAIGRDDGTLSGGGGSRINAPIPPTGTLCYRRRLPAATSALDGSRHQVKSIAVWPNSRMSGGAATLAHRFSATAPIVTSARLEHDLLRRRADDL